MAVALTEILPKNRNTGSMGLYTLLGYALGLNRAQLAAVRATRIENQLISDRIQGE